MAPEQLALLTARKRGHVPAVTFEFTAFTPAEAEAITGASPIYQRELRRRGVITHKGHARFDLVGLGVLMVLRLLMDRSKPSTAAPFAKAAAFGIAWHALAFRDGYAGDHERVLLWDAELGPQIESWQAAVALLRDERFFGPEALAEVARVATDPTLRFNGWTAQATWLRKEIFRLRQAGNLVPMPRFALWLPNGEYVFRNSVDIAFKERRLVPILARGPLVVLDQEQLGDQLLESMKRVSGGAFVHVHIEGDKA